MLTSRLKKPLPTPLVRPISSVISRFIAQIWPRYDFIAVLYKSIHFYCSTVHLWNIVKRYLIKKYEMNSVTALLALYSLPHIRNVEVVIDGTIDFGPNWTYEYKLKPINGFEPRKTISDNLTLLLSNDNIAKASEQENEADTSEIVEDTNKNIEHEAKVALDESSDGVVDEENVFGVTKLYKTEIKKDVMLKIPRKIKDETELINFVDHVKKETLKMFDNISDKFEDKVLVQKINELKQRYSNKFNEFQNHTQHHTIRTTFGDKKVILNTIDYSNKLLDRLVNRFKIDMMDSGLRSGVEASNTFQEHRDNLRKLAYEDACKMFSICRAGKEFSDHISELITNLLEHDDAKVQSAVEATTKALKFADFSRIMDAKTEQAFNMALSTLEELNPFELRVLLMAYKLLIDNRHQPFLERNPKNPWVKVTVAVFHVMEGFNKQIIIDTKEWNVIKKDFKRWLAGDKVDVKNVAKRLTDRVQNKIAALDNKTANDFKAKLRLCMAAKSLRMSLSSYVQFQPFVI